MIEIIENTKPQYYAVDPGTPKVPVHLYREKLPMPDGLDERYRKLGEWRADVARCCYCSGNHQHVVCVGHADPFRFLGMRLAPCSFFRGEEASYELIAISEFALTSPMDHRWLDVHFPLVEIKPKTQVDPTRQSSQPTARISIGPELRAEVWDKTRGRCWYCGVEMHPFRNYHVDHYIPIVDGGSNDISNLVPSCQACNSRKHARPAEYLRRFIASGKFYGEREEWP